MFIIGGIQKTTLLDFPQKVAAIVFTQGCNLRCGYCHNPQLLQLSQNSEYSTEKFFQFLQERTGKLDGVVITGGEPTLQSGIFDFMFKIKSMGFAIKLDTNGTNPDVVQKLIDNELIDCIAMDIKAPFEKYFQITGMNINIDNIKNSIKLIMNSGIEYEFRTTVIKSQLSTEDILEIGKTINGANLYYLQKFRSSEIYNRNLAHEISYSDEEFELLCQKLKLYIKYPKFR